MPDKSCSRCKAVLPISSFATDQSRSDGLSKWCRECVREKGRAHYERNREQVLARQRERREADPEAYRLMRQKSEGKPENRERKRAYNVARYREKRVEILAKNSAQHRARKFGLTAESFDALLRGQGGCAICGITDARWHVDHDHGCCATTPTCGRCVRGILCGQCNTALGLFRDSAEVCSRAAAYLTSRSSS